MSVGGGRAPAPPHPGPPPARFWPRVTHGGSDPPAPPLPAATPRACLCPGGKKIRGGSGERGSPVPEGAEGGSCPRGFQAGGRERRRGWRVGPASEGEGLSARRSEMHFSGLRLRACQRCSVLTKRVTPLQQTLRGPTAGGRTDGQTDTRVPGRYFHPGSKEKKRFRPATAVPPQPLPGPWVAVLAPCPRGRPGTPPRQTRDLGGGEGIGGGQGPGFLAASRESR